MKQFLLHIAALSAIVTTGLSVANGQTPNPGAIVKGRSKLEKLELGFVW
jgi:hypothetical protein